MMTEAIKYKLHKTVGIWEWTILIKATICQIPCLVTSICECICTIFMKKMLVLNHTKLIGVYESNLGRSLSGRNACGDIKTFGIGRYMGQV